ncbi:hypothetical protein GYMLUDRAFT_70356 [Collybiopsis luxurians FD-317 M1]|nr:hypothetical protein GYMLUDRAFT_70356 [Collybiopsis luxurians FD-317 M1]
MSVPLKFEFYEHPIPAPSLKASTTQDLPKPHPISHGPAAQPKIRSCNTCRTRKRKCERPNGANEPCFRCIQDGERCITEHRRILRGRKPGPQKKPDPIFQNTFHYEMKTAKSSSSIATMTPYLEQRVQESRKHFSALSYPNPRPAPSMPIDYSYRLNGGYDIAHGSALGYERTFEDASSMDYAENISFQYHHFNLTGWTQGFLAPAQLPGGFSYSPTFSSSSFNQYTSSGHNI